MQANPSLERPSGSELVIIVLILCGTIFCLLPILCGWQPASERSPAAIDYLLLYAIPFLAGVACYCLDRQSERRWLAEALILAAMLALVVNALHFTLVDEDSGAGYFGRDYSNVRWQEWMQEKVLQLSPSVLPHAYRFLPNSFVRLYEMVLGDYPTARDAYRNLFGLLLFYALYRYARLYVGHVGGLLTQLLFAVVYPISFRYYAGQLTDPMSHLAFVLAFIFLEEERFWLLLLTLLVGSLAKETLLALMGYYALAHCCDRNSWLRILILAGSGLAMYLGIRALVLHGELAYANISGVTPEHIAENWEDLRWPLQLLLTIGPLLPFAVLAWPRAPRSLSWLAIYMAIVLFVSSLIFSWLVESRNFMALAAVLAVMSALRLSGGFTAEKAVS
jgi:hypothetical protein